MSASDIRRIGFDCEFIPNDLTNAGLLSMAFYDDMGNRLYMINSEADKPIAKRIPFLREVVMPHIERGTGDPMYSGPVGMRMAVLDFLNLHNPALFRPKLYAWCGAQDMVRLHGLWNHDWSIMPRVVPHSFTDIEELLFRYGIN